MHRTYDARFSPLSKITNTLSSGAWTACCPKFIRSHCSKEKSRWEQRVRRLVRQTQQGHKICCWRCLVSSSLSQRKRRNATSTISSLHDLCKFITGFDMGLWFCDIDHGRRRTSVFPRDKLAGKWWPHLFFAHVGPLAFVCLSAVHPTHTRGRGDAVAVPLPSVRNWIWMRLSSRGPKLPRPQNTTFVSM